MSSPSTLTVNATATPTRAVNLSSADRMRVFHALSATAGYAAPSTILPEGTALWEVGEENLRRHRASIDTLPTMRDFAQAFLAAESLRDHRDVEANLADMRMLPDGRIMRVRLDGKAPPAIGYTHTGLSQLVSLYRDHLGIPNGMVGSLEFLSPKVRAEAFNDLAERADERMVHVRELPDRVFRTSLNVHGERFLRAVTSTQHTLQAGGYAAIVAQIARLWPEAKCRAVRTEDRFDLDVIFPMHSREIRVGDVLHGTLSVTLSETKDVAASVKDALLRVLCANLTVKSFGKEASFTRRHVGAAFVRDLADRMRGGWNRLAPFVEAFGDSYGDALPAGLPTRAETVERTFKKFAVELKGLAAQSVIQAWDLDGARSAGNTRAGLVHALTRASQNVGVEQAEEIETVAGTLIERGWAALA